MLSLANLLNDTVSGGLSLKTLKCALERFILLNSNLTHYIPSLRCTLQGANFHSLHFIIQQANFIVNQFQKLFTNNL